MSHGPALAGLMGMTNMTGQKTVLLAGANGVLGDRILTEDDPFAPPAKSRQMEKHVRAMRLKEQQAFTTDGIDGIALRFGFLYGPGGTDALVAMLRKRKIPAPGGHGLLPWVD